MDLKKKLALLKDAGPGSSAPKAPEQQAPIPEQGGDDGERRARIEHLRGLIREVMSRSGASSQKQEVTAIDVNPQTLPGGLRDTPCGQVHIAEEHLEPDHCQGRTPVASALSASSAAIAALALDPELGSVDPRRMLFIDTETTGLVGGTGTVPFLVGLASFDDESLHIEQLFLRQLGHEGPLLHVLSERLATATLLVSYNGKTFDWPLLRTRYVMNQLEPPLPPPHLDLLHCARRVYKRRLGACKLVNVEEHVLGLRREHDIEGSEIPVRYLDFLRSGNEAQLVPVIEHNAHDIVSLASLVGRLAGRYTSLEPSDEPEDHLGYAQVAQRAGDEEKALEFAGAAMGGGDDGVRVDAGLFTARLLKRRRDIGGQERVLMSALEAAGWAGPEASPVHLALAKLHEHSLKDLEGAMRHAQLAVGAETHELHQRRIERLNVRLARQRLERQPCSSDPA